jgi:uncharacterized oligopeptide transporter (OPT) family protein
MAMEPAAEARYALDHNVDRSGLPPAAQLEYDRLLAERKAADKSSGLAGPGGASAKHSRGVTTEQVEAAYSSGSPLVRAAAVPATMQDYARQTRNATVFIAWVVGIFAALSLIGGIIIGVNLIHAVNNINGSDSSNSNCASLGGTNPNC